MFDTPLGSQGEEQTIPMAKDPLMNAGSPSSDANRGNVTNAAVGSTDTSVKQTLGQPLGVADNAVPPVRDDPISGVPNQLPLNAQPNVPVASQV